MTIRWRTEDRSTVRSGPDRYEPLSSRIAFRRARSLRKAKHGIDVPLIIENSIDETKGEIAKLEAQAQESREKLAALVGPQPM
jgi:hypothetical protein